MKKVIILSGISGSGKSTYGRKLLEGALWTSVCSADDYFMVGSEYRFDASKLSLAHGQCFKKFIDLLKGGDQVVVVDNTNTSVVEIAPYVLGGQAWDGNRHPVTFKDVSIG